MYYEHKVRIVLHGYLRKLYSGPLEFSGHSVSEIINGMCKATKAFNPIVGQGKHTIKVVGFETKEALFNAIDPSVEELHLVPEMCGGKSGGFFRIAIGAVLIAAAFYTGGLSLAGPTLFGSTTISSLMFNFGLSLVLGGLLELISPQPKADAFGNNDADPEASKYLGATANTVKIGTRIPLAYGEVLAYGHYLSFDVDAKDVAI